MVWQVFSFCGVKVFCYLCVSLFSSPHPSHLLLSFPGHFPSCLSSFFAPSPSVCRPSLAFFWMDRWGVVPSAHWELGMELREDTRPDSSVVPLTTCLLCVSFVCNSDFILLITLNYHYYVLWKRFRTRNRSRGTEFDFFPSQVSFSEYELFYRQNKKINQNFNFFLHNIEFKL